MQNPEPCVFLEEQEGRLGLGGVEQSRGWGQAQQGFLGEGSGVHPDEMESSWRVLT